MSQASMQFAPQWLKKPSATSVPPPARPRSSSPPVTSPTSVTLNSINTGISYSHMANPTSARSESFPSDGVPNGAGSWGQGGPNGIPLDEARPFRYSKEAMLALYDSVAVKNRPLELLELAEGGGVVLSGQPNVPFGFTEWSEEEKKTFTTSLNPPTRPRAQHPPVTATPDREPPAPFLRRGTTSTSISSTTIGGGRSVISGGFGRGEGGAFGGGKVGGDAPVVEPPRVERDTRDIGFRDRGERTERTDRGERHVGTFGGSTGFVNGAFGASGTDVEAGRRPGRVLRGAVGRGVAEGDAPVATTPVRSSNTAATWRPSPRNPSVSGSFEGVLGFGGASGGQDSKSVAETPAPPVPAVVGWREREKAATGGSQIGTPERSTSGLAGVMPLAGGGTGWTKGGGRWRMAAQAEQAEQTEKRPGANATVPPSSVDVEPATSVVAIPTDTPVEERMYQLSTSGEAQGNVAPPPPTTAPEDVQWYYTDPAGLQQGPFTAPQMQDWFSHNYFVDSLPLRREHESEYRTLAQLVEETGDAASPFLATPKHRSAAPSPPRHVVDSPSHIQPTNGMHSSPFASNVQPMAFDPMMQAHAHAQAHAQRSVWDNNMRPSPFSQHEIGAPIASPFGRPLDQMPNPMFGGADPNVAMRMAQQVQYNGSSPWGMVPHPMAFGQPIPPQFAVPSANGPSPAYQNLPSQGPTPSSDSYQQTSAPAWPLPPVAHQHVAPAPQQEHNHIAPVEPDVKTSVATSLVESSVSSEAEKANEQPSPVPSPAPVPQTPVVSERKVQKPSSALPPPPASLPAKPVTVVLPPPKETLSTTEEPLKTSPPPSVEPVAKKATASAATEATPASSPSTSKAAPWAKDEERPKAASGPSLRDIQVAEAREADAKKAADVKARAAAQAAIAPQMESETVHNMSWGLPSKPSSAAIAAAAASSAAPAHVWGQGDAVVKKTLKQIQEEEEKRRKVATAAKLAASNGAVTRRGYADLAAVPSAPAVPQPGWSTVGAGGKTTAIAPTPVRASVVSSPLSKTPVPSTPPVKVVVKPSAASLDEIAPSVEFIRWTKEALKGLAGVNLDEFIQMLLTFPVEPGASSRADQLEIISDSVYANSSTLDGRRFAQEFYTKRKADAQNRLAAPNAIKAGTVRSNSLAEIVKTQPKQSNTDFGGFKVVKPKGKGRK